jgi:hypothetical protein
MVLADFNQYKVLHLVPVQKVDFLEWLSFMCKQLEAMWEKVFDKLVISLNT